MTKQEKARRWAEAEKKRREIPEGHPDEWFPAELDARAAFGDDAWACERCDAWTPPGRLVCDDCTEAR